MKVLFRYMYIASLFLASNPLFSQSEPYKDSLVLFTYSLGNIVSDNANKIVSKNWPFTTEPKAGDLVDEIIIKEIKQNNIRVWKYLESIGYENPKKKYYSEVYAEEAQLKSALGIVNEHPKVVRLFKRLRKRNLTSFTQLTKLCDSQYKFEIFSFDTSNIEKSEELEIKLIADIENNTARVIRN